MLFDQRTGEIQTQPGPTDAPRLGIFRSHEAPKNLPLLVCGNADTMILHAEVNYGGSLSFPQVDRNRSSLRTVLDGIADEIYQDLLSTSRINIGHHHWARRMYLHQVARGRFLQRSSDTLGQRNDVGRGALQDQAPCLQASYLQQILAERYQASSCLFDLFESLPLPVGQFRAMLASGLHDEHIGI